MGQAMYGSDKDKMMAEYYGLKLGLRRLVRETAAVQTSVIELQLASNSRTVIRHLGKDCSKVKAK